MKQTLKCEIIHLRGKTLKGKNRIQQWGEVWIVQDNRPSELVIMSLKESPTLGRDIRRIDKENDKDFEIIPFFEESS
jgi:hypothetical protein